MSSDLAVAPVPVGEPLHPRHQARPLVSSEAFPVTGPRALPFAKVSGVAAMIDPVTWSQLQVTAVSGAERLPGRAGCFFATATEGRPDRPPHRAVSRTSFRAEPVFMYGLVRSLLDQSCETSPVSWVWDSEPSSYEGAVAGCEARHFDHVID